MLCVRWLHTQSDVSGHRGQHCFFRIIEQKILDRYAMERSTDSTSDRPQVCPQARVNKFLTVSGTFTARQRQNRRIYPQQSVVKSGDFFCICETPEKNVVRAQKPHRNDIKPQYAGGHPAGCPLYIVFLWNGRDGKIRTCDLRYPKPSRYQAALRPETAGFLMAPSGNEKPQTHLPGPSPDRRAFTLSRARLHFSAAGRDGAPRRPVRSRYAPPTRH